MSTGTLLFAKENNIGVLTLNNPDALNALPLEGWEELRETCFEIKKDPDVRVVVITGTGDRAFCTGTDLKKTAKPADESFVSTYFDFEIYLAGLKMWKPTIAAINGYCIGGGLEMAMACDLRVASSKASFGLTEVKVASLPGLGGMQRLIRAVPKAVAMKMILSGERVNAQEAYRIGLISDVFEPEALMEGAMKIAAQIAANAPLSVKAAKQACVVGADLPLDQATMFDVLLWGILRDTEDRLEGRKAFAEKRPPQYKGK
jgi:E-phenylitaconyl-CoA hydratase/naphthyl-2-hydroxymethylsuccinyl-CoA hydratase